MPIIQMGVYRMRKCPICHNFHNGENWRVGHPRCYSEFKKEKAIYNAERYHQQKRALSIVRDPIQLNAQWNNPDC